MEIVWLLWFEQEESDGEETELLIGVYKTEENAQAAIARLQKQPGFRDYPEGFKIYAQKLDQDSWTQGFSRVS